MYSLRLRVPPHNEIDDLANAALCRRTSHSQASPQAQYTYTRT